MKKQPWTVKDRLDAIQGFCLIAGLIFAAYQLHLQTKALQDTQKVNSATFVLKISDEFEKPRYENLMNDIDDHDGKYSLKKKYKRKDIEDYIGNFETLGNLIGEGLISEKMAYDELGYEVEKAWCNEDIKAFVDMTRTIDKNNSGSKAFYIGFEQFALSCLKMDNKTCEGLNTEIRKDK